MGSQPRRVDHNSIIQTAAASLEQVYPDLASWPEIWKVEHSDIAIGKRILELIEPFLLDLLQHRLAHNTLARHRDHIQMLGGEIIRRRHDDPDLAKQPVQDLLLNLIEEDGGPLIYPRITESAQNSFDATCRTLYRFLNKRKNGT